MSRVNRYRYRRQTIVFELVMLALYLVGVGSAILAVSVLSSSGNVRAVSQFAIAAALSLGFLVNAIVKTRQVGLPEEMRQRKVR